MNEPAPSRGGRRGRRDRTAEGAPVRKTDYRRLRNPFPQMNLYSEDQIAAIHDAALMMLEELGMKILLPEARRIFAGGGA